jgi:hypothetical protein
MAIKWVEDLGAPAVVALADIVTTERKPDWNRPVGIGLAAAGYILGGVMGMGGTFVKNLGIASAPWAFESIYQYIKEGTATPAAARVAAPAYRIAATEPARVPTYQAEEQVVFSVT